MFYFSHAQTKRVQASDPVATALCRRVGNETPALSAGKNETKNGDIAPLLQKKKRTGDPVATALCRRVGNEFPARSAGKNGTKNGDGAPLLQKKKSTRDLVATALCRRVGKEFPSRSAGKNRLQRIACHLVAFLLSVALCAMAFAQEPSPTPDPSAIAFEALVMPEYQIDLASPSEGIVTGILVKEGSPIAPGEALVRLNSEEEEIRLRNSDLVARQLGEDAKALKRLYEEKAASRDDSNRASLQAQQAIAERDLLAIRLRDRTISSPIKGSVLRILKDPGESVQRLEKVVEIVALDKKFLTGYLNISHMGAITPGMKATIRTPNAKAGDMAGTVEVVDPVLDPGGEVFRVKVVVDDPQGLLNVGTRVPVEIGRK